MSNMFPSDITSKVPIHRRLAAVLSLFYHSEPTRTLPFSRKTRNKEYSSPAPRTMTRGAFLWVVQISKWSSVLSPMVCWASSLCGWCAVAGGVLGREGHNFTWKFDWTIKMCRASFYAAGGSTGHWYILVSACVSIPAPCSPPPTTHRALNTLRLPTAWRDQHTLSTRILIPHHHGSHNLFISFDPHVLRFCWTCWTRADGVGYDGSALGGQQNFLQRIPRPQAG